MTYVTRSLVRQAIDRTTGADLTAVSRRDPMVPEAGFRGI